MQSMPIEGAGISLWAAVLSNALPAFRAPQDDPAGVACPLDDDIGTGSGEGDGSSRNGAVAKRKGAYRTGERNHMSKKSDEDCREMRRMREQFQASFAEIGIAFGCSPHTVRDICERRTRAEA